MRFGYWMPIFGGWLRNVEDEGMAADWAYVRALAVESEAAGFDLSLIAELNLNDIKGHRAPSLDAWTLAPAVAAVTERLELMLAVRPNYHSPSLTAKALSTLDTIAPGRISLNVVSSWWKDEATQYGAPFDVHDARYARTEEWLTVLHRLLTEGTVTHRGELYDLQGCVMEPKPSVLPTVYMGGESPKAKDVIAQHGGAYVMHGDAPDVIAAKVADMTARAAAHGKTFSYGVSGFVIVRDTEAEAQAELARILDVQSSPAAYASYQDFVAGSQLESQVSLEEYSVSNRGLRAGLVGTPEQVSARIRDYEAAGVDLMLLQFSPQREEMARFGEQVIRAHA
ncbi:MAG: Coenzyme F420-dependent N5,N10-methylene tetrahydromethanopterin reductase and related flavin-dependent oxidoreductases; sulfonate monooxygenase [uncultured Frankineae bacterium]|uniref:Coenzyme F420-dependent N5,N10-methylene tetrahydromethanopterin reductase and related flavin-dependent oxidoreductases sulfonate monooxygenase n=1 Tax=uncultured Frankineae bacterium TaxID=437475 RepID=A0A6J4KY66_9ACTN|nr:MAG: Coenzyme F420-dependent N5,N10-methylene tetrahydromethanopterin reductase and related flavin-dependent oxidoreductases; sulfonate monooxygenase [uncultured Frankineae bacterium]